MMDKVPLYTLSGEIIHGRGIGKLVGMPTANLQIPEGENLPPGGVYITRILYDGQVYYGMTNIGTRPTVDTGSRVSVETHILDFDRQIYGERLEIELFHRLRSTEKFVDFSALLQQIQKDCTAAESFFGIKRTHSRLWMSQEKHQIKTDDHEIYLSAREFDLLYMLYSHPDSSFTKEQLYEAVWHEPANHSVHAVENTVFQIRKRLRPYAAGHNYIKTVVGYGYKYNA